MTCNYNLRNITKQNERSSTADLTQKKRKQTLDSECF